MNMLRTSRTKKFLVLFFVGLIFVLLCGAIFLLSSLSTPKTLTILEKEFNQAGQGIAQDLSRIPSLPWTEEDKAYKIQDTKESGIRIEFAGEEKKEAEKGLALTLPKNYQEGIQVSLDPQRTISLTDLSGKDGYTADTLTQEVVEQERQTGEKQSLFARLFPKKQDLR